MTTDPALPARLEWAAGQVQSILADDAWRPFVSAFAVADQISNMNFVLGMNPPDIWVGDAYEAHVKDLGNAADAVRAARQRLEALVDVLHARARAATASLEREAAAQRADDNPFGAGPFGSSPFTY
jgi:hypothetical protein